MVFIKFVRQIIGEQGKDKVSQLSAALAFVALFALGPLLLVMVSLVGLVFGHSAVSGHLATQLSGTVGPNTAATIQKVVAHTYQSHHGVGGLVVGSLGLLLAASGLVNQLKSGFNQIFQATVKSKPGIKAGIKHFILPRIKNIVALLVGSGVIVVSAIVSTVVVALGTKLQLSIGLPPATLEILNFATSLGLLVLILGLMYRSLPDVWIPWGVALGSGLIIGLLFVAGKTVLAWIIGRNGAASAYGAAASLISLLLWFYYIGQILFLGAEGIKAYGQNHGIKYVAKQK